jgi:hypothetical protein
LRRQTHLSVCTGPAAPLRRLLKTKKITSKSNCEGVRRKRYRTRIAPTSKLTQIRTQILIFNFPNNLICRSASRTFSRPGSNLLGRASSEYAIGAEWCRFLDNRRRSPPPQIEPLIGVLWRIVMRPLDTHANASHHRRLDAFCGRAMVD